MDVVLVKVHAVPSQSGGVVVGALGLAGPVEELFGVGGELRPTLAEQLLGASREISVALL